MLLVTKKSEGKRPVLNLKPLNKFVPNQTFKMEGIHLLNPLRAADFSAHLSLATEEFSQNN